LIALNQIQPLIFYKKVSNLQTSPKLKKVRHADESRYLPNIKEQNFKIPQNNFEKSRVAKAVPFALR
jgi:hypothetical protein